MAEALAADQIIIQLVDGDRVIRPLLRYSSASMRQTRNGRGHWQIVAPHSDQLGEWLNRDYPGVCFWSPATGWRAGGPVSTDRVDYQRDRQVLTVSGPDWVGDMASRLVWPGFNLNATDWSNVRDYRTTGLAPEEAVWRWLSQIIEAPLYNPVAADRAQPWRPRLVPFAGAVNPVQAIPVDGVGFIDRAKEVLDAVGFGIFLDVTATTTNELDLEFRVAQPPVSPRPLSVADGSIERIQRTRSRARVTRMFAAGNSGATIFEASTPSENWRTAYGEEFIDLGSLAGSDAQAELVRRLALAGPKEMVSGENPALALWGRDLDIGWSVRLIIPDRDGTQPNSEISTVVEAATVEIDAERDNLWRRSVVFGDWIRQGTDLLMQAIAEQALRAQRLDRKI